MNALVRWAMCAMMPPTAALPGVADTDIDAFVRKYRAETNWMMWLGLLGGSFVVLVTPVITVGLPVPGFLLSKKRLELHVSRIAMSRIYTFRQAVFLVKMGAGMCWAAHPSVRERLGLPPYPADPGTWRA